MPGTSPSEETPAEPVSDLSTVIQESQQALTETPPAPVKNKGGRPKGSRNKPKTADETPPQQAAPPVPQVSLAPLLGKVASLPYGIAAARTHFEGFRLTAEEQLEIGGSLDAVVLKYFPNLTEQAGVGVMAMFTILSVTMAKMQAYETWKAEIIARAKAMHEQGVVEIKPADTPQSQPQTDLSGNPFVSKI